MADFVIGSKISTIGGKIGATFVRMFAIGGKIAGTSVTDSEHAPPLNRREGVERRQPCWRWVVWSGGDYRFHTPASKP